MVPFGYAIAQPSEQSLVVWLIDLRQRVEGGGGVSGCGMIGCVMIDKSLVVRLIDLR